MHILFFKEEVIACEIVKVLDFIIVKLQTLITFPVRKWNIRWELILSGNLRHMTNSKLTRNPPSPPLRLSLVDSRACSLTRHSTGVTARSRLFGFYEVKLEKYERVSWAGWERWAAVSTDKYLVVNIRLLDYHLAVTAIYQLSYSRTSLESLTILFN